jgi:hypothetical protein
MTKIKLEEGDWRREAGVIDEIREGPSADHGGCYIAGAGVMSGGGHEGFGYLALDKQAHDSFVANLRVTFGVKTTSALIGKRCYLLRAWNSHAQSPCGIENAETGTRMLVETWARAAGIKNVMSPLEKRTEQLKNEIACFEERIRRAKRDLEQVEVGYIDWTKQ